MEFYFLNATKGKDRTQVTDKRAIWDKLKSVIKQIPSTIEREHWLQKVASFLQINIDQLREDLGKREEERNIMVVEKKTFEGKRDRRDHTSIFVLGICVHEPRFLEEIMRQLLPEHFSEGKTRELYNVVMLLYTQFHTAVQNSFYERLSQNISPDLLPTLQEAVILGEQISTDASLEQVRQQLNDAIHFLKDAALKEKRRILHSLIQEAEKAHESKKAEDLSRQFHEL